MVNEVSVAMAVVVAVVMMVIVLNISTCVTKFTCHSLQTSRPTANKDGKSDNDDDDDDDDDDDNDDAAATHLHVIERQRVEGAVAILQRRQVVPACDRRGDEGCVAVVRVFVYVAAADFAVEKSEHTRCPSLAYCMHSFQNGFRVVVAYRIVGLKAVLPAQAALTAVAAAG